MPFAYTIDADLDLWYVVGWDLVTGTDYFNYLAAAAVDENFHYGIDLLLDFHEVTDMDFSLEDLEAIASLDRDLNPSADHPRYRIAAVVRKELDIISVQLYQALVQSPSVMIESFYTHAAALRWLGREQHIDRIEELRRQILDNGQPPQETSP